MLDKVKGKLSDIREDGKKRKEELERIAREKAEEEARKERERIQAEKDTLMAFSDKELMVEAIMALRGYNTRLNKIEEKQNDLEDRVDSLEWDVNSLDSRTQSSD